jgi:E3 ubiquitin-protein ligase BAH
MKFAHDFDEALKREEYPQEWVDSAISYRQLKKCIKKVQAELKSFGLDAQTLELLWQNVNGAKDENGTKNGGEGQPKGPFRYSISREYLAAFPRYQD